MSKKILFHNELGSTAVEFAVLAPMILALVFGIIEFGTIFYDQILLTNASREGARAGIGGMPRATLDDIERAVISTLKPGDTTLLINYKDDKKDWKTDLEPGPCVNQGDRLLVTVTYQYDFLALDAILNIVSMFHHSIPKLKLHATTAMTCE